MILKLYNLNRLYFRNVQSIVTSLKICRIFSTDIDTPLPLHKLQGVDFSKNTFLNYTDDGEIEDNQRYIKESI